MIPSARHCQIAEIAAFLEMAGLRRPPGEKPDREFVLKADSEETMSLLFTLFQRAYNIDVVLSRDEKRSYGRSSPYIIRMPDEESARVVRQSAAHRSVLQMECCKTAFLRGAFLAGGSVSDPEKSYHLEIVCQNEETAELIRSTMQRIGTDARIVLRKGNSVVYLKEGDQIVYLLGGMGASNSFLNIESVRVLKEMRERVNRRVNCETANLGKTIASAVRQIEDIRFLRDNGGFRDLPEGLREMAEVRLEYPDAPLAELGMYLDPPIGKSGVNHRLRKLSALAAEQRGE